jgi:repressor LexA
MEPLTDRQARVLEFIRTQIASKGRPPTLDEIGERFFIASTNGVRRHLTALEKKGYIVRDAGTARGIRLSDEFREEAGLPIVGRVAAGTPILAVENVDGHLPIEGLFHDPKGLYCLRVEGDSMIEADIHDGDFVVVRQQSTFDNGEIGIAIIDEECTVKKLHQVGSQIELRPANPKYEPQRIDPAECEFAYGGKVIRVVSIREPVGKGF